MNESLVVTGLLLLVIVMFFFTRRVESYEDPKTKEIHQKLIKVDHRAKNISVVASNQSFTEDKSRTYLCLRDEEGNYYDDNMLMYVALHELAHVISKSVDPHHTTQEFNNNFKLLLKKAEDVGVFDPKLPLNYSYCPNTPEIQRTNSKAVTVGGVVEVNK